MDSNKRPDSWRVRSWLSALGGAVIGIWASLGVIDETPSPDQVSGQFLTLGLVFVIGFYLLVLLHELGHLFGGWLGGMRFVRIAVSRLSVYRKPKGLGVGWTRNPGFAGFVMMSPTGESFDPAGFRKMISAGPIASGIGAIACSALIPMAESSGSTGLRFGAWLLVFFSVTLCFGNLVPYRTAQGSPSDGLWLKLLRSPGPEVERLAAILMITRSALSGLRPRDWDRKWIEVPVVPGDTSLSELNMALLRHSFYLDRQEWDRFWEAEAAMEAQLETSPYPASLLYQVGVIDLSATYAWLRSDPETAESWMKRVEKWHPLFAHFQDFVGATCSCARGDGSAALSQIDRFIDAHRRFEKRNGSNQVATFEYAEAIRARAEELVRDTATLAF